MTFFSSLKDVITRAATRVEGGRITGPLAPVSQPEQGWIPMSWPLNFWQLGYNVLPLGDNAIVEACVWAYIRAIAQLPGYHRILDDDGGVENVTTSALSRLLRNPNPYETPSDFMVHLIRSLLFAGNSYWIAQRNDRNEVAALHWTNPRQAQPVEIAIEGQREREVFYAFGNDNPLITFEALTRGDRFAIPARDVLHIKLATPRHPLIGETWLAALSSELANRGAMNMTMSAQFQNQSRPSGVLTTDLNLTTEQVKDLRERWNEQSQGMNSGGTPILTSGLKFQPVSVSNQDAQIIESLKLNDRTIAAVFGVPAMLIGIDQGGTAVKTAEQVMTEWLASGLGFLLNHIELQIDKFIGLVGVQAGEYTEFDTRALLRSMFRDRIEGLARGVQTGIYSPNEARELEGYPAVPDGDEPRVQQQVVPLSFANKPPAQPQPPQPASGNGSATGGDQAPPDEGQRDLFEAAALTKMRKAFEHVRLAA